MYVSLTRTVFHSGSLVFAQCADLCHDWDIFNMNLVQCDLFVIRLRKTDAVKGFETSVKSALSNPSCICEIYYESARWFLHGGLSAGRMLPATTRV